MQLLQQAKIRYTQGQQLCTAQIVAQGLQHGRRTWVGHSARRLAMDCSVWTALMLSATCAGLRTAVETAATTSRNLHNQLAVTAPAQHAVHTSALLHLPRVQHATAS